MKKALLMVTALLIAGSTNIKAQDMKEKPILRNDIKLDGNLMTPEALWAMGRIGNYAFHLTGNRLCITLHTTA